MGFSWVCFVVSKKWLKFFNFRSLYQGVKWKGLKQSRETFGKIIRK